MPETRDVQDRAAAPGQAEAGQVIIQPEVNIGTLLGVASILITLLTLHAQNRRRFERMEHKVDILWEMFETRLRRDEQRRDRERRGGQP